ncbi:unnamed protein product, partial [marine sediment metagenome]
YCEYNSVCRFDWQINDYNVLVSLGSSFGKGQYEYVPDIRFVGDDIDTSA